MGDLPLRTPIHRRLGGPLPRRLSNGTHPHPRPVLTFLLSLMQRKEYIADYPYFRKAVHVSGPGRIRVTHPCAGRHQDRCRSHAAPRLACVKPVASVHPEPGSNSSLYKVSFSLFPWPDFRLLSNFTFQFFIDGSFLSFTRINFFLTKSVYSLLYYFCLFFAIFQ